MNTQPLFTERCDADRLGRARAHERVAEERVRQIARTFIELHRIWREAELEATREALRGRGQVERAMAALYSAQLEELSEQSAAADAALTMARNARMRLQSA